MTTIVIPGERPMSWNEFYTGSHWTTRTKEAKRVHMLVRTYCLATGLRYDETFKRPVKITMKVYFKSHPQDASNIALKLYEDGLKGYLIDDDSPKHVQSVETFSFVDKDDPRVEIIVEEVKS